MAFENVPKCLRSLKQWVNWKLQQRNGDKPTKVPVTIAGYDASSTNPADWYSFESVCKHAQKFDGIGFVFTESDPFVGIDIDDCFASPGELKPWAEPIVKALTGTYSEVSPSGNGLKFFCRGQQLDKGRKVAIGDGKLEIYSSGRFFTVTGQVWDDSDCVEIDSDNWKTINAYFPAEPQTPKVSPCRGHQVESDKVDRAAKYLETMKPSISGCGGHDACFRAACKMVLGFDLDQESAYSLLASVYNPRCVPPWTEKELRHKVKQADKQTSDRGYLLTEPARIEHYPDVDLSAFCVPDFEPDRSELEIGRDVQDPGPFPEDCLLPPGFIAEVARYTIATSNEPQPILALGGALCLLSVLTGRKIRNRRNNRTNLFVLGLGPSGCGKDRPREVNSDILTEIGSLDMIGPVSLGSGHGIESQLRAHPCRLFQLDEIGDLLKSIKKERGSGHMEAILQKIKMLMTSAHQVYSNSATSDIKAFFTINQPHLVIFGTATPEKFWNNLSVESIEDGFMGRLLPLEVVGYGDTQEPQDIELPPSIIEQAREWVAFSPGGSLAAINPYPAVYDMTEEATARHKKYCQDIDRKIPKDGSHKKTDGLWKRARGRAASLALLFAASRIGPTETGVIDLCDVEMAIKVINWITRKTIYKVLTQVHENQFEHNCNRVLDIIRKGQIDRSALSQKTRWLKLNERKEILQTLQDRGDVSAIEVETKTNTRLEFRANF